ncbi:MAG TPA: MFS transporter [Pirellulaceae bacterium]|nr:MFS transporter [Pirellulaceae bacterium]
MSAESPYAVLRHADYRRFLGGNLLALFGSQMQTVAVGWELYERTGKSLDLGLVGLAQVIPFIALALPAGQVIDHFDRRKVIFGSLVTFMICSIGLAAVSLTKAPVEWIYFWLVVNGAARAFHQPAKSAMLPSLIPAEEFTSAVTWSTSGFQLATIVGPGLGGLVIAWTKVAHWVYWIDAVLVLFFMVQLLRIAPRPMKNERQPVTFRTLLGGVSFVWRTKIVLAALSLDMFAVLLGGATALLPVYAKDILQSGPETLGWLRAAPGAGALVVSFFLAHSTPIRRAGPVLLWSVAGFGIATIVFGISRNFWLAWTMLLLTGGLDMISVIIRHTLVQTATPDEMRGRVSAVNGLFISISNEMGAFESGAVAYLFASAVDPTFGPTVSVVSGGVGTIVVVLITAALVPSLRRYGKLGGPTD